MCDIASSTTEPTTLKFVLGYYCGETSANVLGDHFVLFNSDAGGLWVTEE